MGQATEIIYRLMEENYDTGQATRIKKATGGYCNKSYTLWMSTGDHSHLYFLRLYHQACRHLPHISSMTEQEHRYLVPMLSIANLYVLNWELVDFYNTPEPDDDGHFGFIAHNIGLLQWIASNEGDLKLWAANSLN